MSGDSTSTGRTGCLKPGEVDPLGQAQACVEQKPTAIPTVGGSLDIVAAFVLAVLMVLIVRKLGR